MVGDRPKYQQVFEVIQDGIRSGLYLPGQKLPSEAALEAEFGTSRITVVRALRELQQLGLVQRGPDPELTSPTVSRLMPACCLDC